jgi:hypothetical protein
MVLLKDVQFGRNLQDFVIQSPLENMTIPG